MRCAPNRDFVINYDKGDCEMKMLIIGLTLFFFPLTSAQAVVKHECSFCHLPHAGEKGMLLKAPVNDLCLGCHPQRKCISEHKVDVIPSMPVPVKDLPLSADGKMTCVTCHDPHRWSSPNLLRMEPSGLCSKCHPEY
ncbi:MAG: cytochrome c3 family protein [Nitrospirota bacterium]